MEDRVRFRSYRRDDRAWVTAANLRFYRTVHGFDDTFADALNAALDLLEDRMSAATSNYLIAEVSGCPVGCIFLSAEAPAEGRIRLFYLDARYRGQGIGMRLLREILNGARTSRFNAVRVSTFDRHPEACRLYESFGFRVLATGLSESFGHVMRRLDYERLLAEQDPPGITCPRNRDPSAGCTRRSSRS